MGKFKVSFMVDELNTNESELSNFLNWQEGVSDVKVEYIPDALETKPEVATDTDDS